MDGQLENGCQYFLTCGENGYVAAVAITAGSSWMSLPYVLGGLQIVKVSTGLFGHMARQPRTLLGTAVLHLLGEVADSGHGAAAFRCRPYVCVCVCEYMWVFVHLVVTTLLQIMTRLLEKNFKFSLICWPSDDSITQAPVAQRCADGVQ